MNYELLLEKEYKKIEILQQEIAMLKQELATLRKLIFGSKKEQFKSTEPAPGQLSLFDDLESQTTGDGPLEPVKELVSYERKKAAKKHEGRNEIPSHLPVEIIIIEPEEDTTGMTKIGEEITETLEYTPASLVKKITKRPKYAKQDGSGIVIGKLPARPIDKGIAEASLLTHIIVSKFIDHLPFYRQIQRFKRDYDWDVSKSTVNDWFVSVCTFLEPLYELMKKKVLESGYLQVDESPIKVLDIDNDKGTHQGYQWVYHSPEQKMVFFDYRKGRGMHGPKEVLEGYKGHLQCDGYTVYDKIGASANIRLAGCLVHARRTFFDAQDNDKKRAEYVMHIFQEIYMLEESIKELPIEEKQKMRTEQMLPLLRSIKEYIEDECLKVLPASKIGKAMTYFQNQWPKLSNAVTDARIELDNNLIENKIRPLALGRKNYLFAGSHDAAQRIAMMYSFFGTCKARGINPNNWLNTTLEKIPTIKIQDIEILIP